MTTQVKERPILFSAPMVRAILEGRKTQTRRVIVEQPIAATTEVRRMVVPNEFGEWSCHTADGAHFGTRRCKFGEPGERLWVRETWRRLPGWNSRDKSREYAFRADGDFPDLTWKPSIFMPREACRILLEVVSVRAERLQAMTHMDWRADFAQSGAEIESALGTFTGDVRRREMSQTFWDSINAERGFTWASNPWVWVIEFRRVP